MKSPQQVWDSTSNDPRWYEDPVAMVALAMREAYGAGFEAGANTTARAVDDHADALGKNLAVPVHSAVPAGLRATANVCREIGVSETIVSSSWRQEGGPKLVQPGARR